MDRTDNRPAVSARAAASVKSLSAAEFTGVAGEFRCHSLHRSQIFKDL
jgi:hypothetical protein